MTRHVACHHSCKSNGIEFWTTSDAIWEFEALSDYHSSKSGRRHPVSRYFMLVCSELSLYIKHSRRLLSDLPRGTLRITARVSASCLPNK